MNTNHLKLEVHDSFKIDEKITTIFKAVNDPDIINKTYLDEKVSKITVTYQYWKKITMKWFYDKTNNLCKKF